MPQIEQERGRFAGLLIAQLFFICVTPFLGDGGTGRVLLLLGIFGMVFAGIYAASNQRWLLYPSCLVLFFVAWSWLGPDLISSRGNETLRVGTVALSYALTAIVIVRALSQHTRVTTNTILGGIDVYLLLAFTFMFLHATAVAVSPDAYTIGGKPIRAAAEAANDPHGIATFLYFSFTTLTTLGYGDIIPTNSFARLLTSAEAVVGQLYVAIFIGRLVGLEVSSNRALIERTQRRDS